MVADGVAPYLLFPMIGGVPYGWISYLGVPTSILTFITIAIIVTLLTAFSSCYDSTCTHVTIVHVLMLRWYMYSCFDSTCTQVSIPMFTIVIPFNIGAIVYFLDDVQLTSEITV
ncbi:unnamed protein product, partial [Mesorhabditis belari]|uniref:Uncharacterized protein n=1 Tax=Mesorhabditis belari TaxID=2138241 RepID=A0AAF3FJB3_9BILA